MLYRPLQDYEIARQIAGLLNDYNNLSRKRRGPEIVEGKTDYVSETHGRLVIAAVGISKTSSTLSEIKHLVVRPEWRRKKVARFILERAMSLSTTPLLYATIREDNTASVELCQSVGLTRERKYWAVNHDVVLLTRISPAWKTIPTGSRSWLDTEPSWEDLDSQ